MTQTPEPIPFRDLTPEQLDNLHRNLAEDAEGDTISLEEAMALVAKHGPIESIATDDFDWLDERPDDDLTDDEFYGRHGWSRDVPTCSDPECPCTGDEDYEAGDQ